MDERPLPAGWVEMERHLVHMHGYPDDYVTALDSDTARQLHMKAHLKNYIVEGSQHYHEER